MPIHGTNDVTEELIKETILAHATVTLEDNPWTALQYSERE